MSALIGSVGALLMLIPSQACTATANVHDVYMALDGNGDRKRNVFYTDSTGVYCVAEVGIGRQGVTIETTLTQLQHYDFVTNQFVDAVRGAAYQEQTPSPNDGIQKLAVKFTPEAPDSDAGTPSGDVPYPPGRYVCEVKLDGEVAGRAIFNIIFPPCPFTLLKPGGQCFGFYPGGQNCPLYGLEATEPAKCVCDPLKGWQCP